MRDAMPVLTTGVRSPDVDDRSHTGPLAFVQATPASTNGAISIGGNGLEIRPKPLVPKSGMRNSAFANASLLPTSRSNCAHELPANPPVPFVQSLLLYELYEYPRTSEPSPTYNAPNWSVSESFP